MDIVANPYARHDMSWNIDGSGLCDIWVSRPNGKLAMCAETYDSAIHGGTRRDLPMQIAPGEKCPHGYTWDCPVNCIFTEI